MEEAIEGQIAALREKRIKQKKELKMLQNENGTRMEQLLRVQEKIRNLTAECEEREREYEELHGKVKAQADSTRGFNGSDERSTAMMQEKFDNDIDELKITEKFKSLLDELSKKIDEKFEEEKKYYQNKLDNEITTDVGSQDKDGLQKRGKSHKTNDDPHSEAYTRSNVGAIAVKLVPDTPITVNPGDLGDQEQSGQKGMFTTFRISTHTKFEDLLHESCKFWGIQKVSDYELVDETEAKLTGGGDHSNIDRYFKLKQGAFNQYLVVLQKKKSTAILVSKQEDIQPTEVKEDNKDELSLNTHKKKKDVDPYAGFFKRFPGLKSYIEIDKTRVEQVRKDREEKKLVKYKLDENYCFVFTGILMLFLFTFIPLIGERSIVSMYYTVTSFKKAFGISNDLYEPDANEPAFDNIKLKTEFYRFLDEIIATKLFYVESENETSDTESDLLANNELKGALRIQQMRVVNKTCDPNAESSTTWGNCFYETYSEDVAYKQDLFSGNSDNWQDDWSTFRTSDELGYSSSFSGELASYDGSGYAVDIPANSHQREVKDLFQQFRSREFVDLSTKAIIITFNFYNQAGEFYTFIELIVEATSTGILLPSRSNIYTYRASFREGTLPRPDHHTYDILRGILAALLTIFVLYKMLCKSRKFSIEYFMTFQGLLNGCIIVLSFLSLAMNNQVNGADVTDLENSVSTYVNAKSFALNYEIAITVMAILSGAALVRTSTILKMNSKFFLIIVALERALKQIVFYAIILAPLIIGFSVVGMNLFGPHLEAFNTFQNAFISMLLFGIGQIDVAIFDRVTDGTLTILFFTSYYFFVVFFLITVFSGIYIDSYRLVIMEYGYRFIDEDAWTIKELLLWAVPKFIIKQVKKWRRGRNSSGDDKTENSTKKKKNKGKKIEMTDAPLTSV